MLLYETVLMISPYLFPLLAFIPGSALLYLISSKYGLKLSPQEIIILGGVTWNYVLVTCGYVVGILSNLMREFFIIFNVISLLLLIYVGYLFMKEKKYSIMRFIINIDKVILLFSYLPLLIIIASLTLSHSIFIEYDAIFTYLPYVKSIVETGGIQYSYYNQNELITSLPPATMLLYAWLRVFCSKTIDFDLGVRIFPLTYILLTALTVYLISKEICQDKRIGGIASLSFLSMPVVLTLASNYALYLDIQFTFLFTLTMFILIRIYERYENDKFWWVMLGLVTSLMLLVKDIGLMLLPALFILILIYWLPFNNKVSITVLALVASLTFNATYNFLFIWDLFHFPVDLISGFVIRQIPVFIICIGLSLLFKTLLQNKVVSKFNVHHAFMFLIPFIPVLIYLIRNIVFFGVITPSFPFLNEGVQIAGALRSQAVGVLKLLPESILNVLRWDILFTSVSLGAIFLIPCLLGLFAVVQDFTMKQSKGKYFILLSFLLMLLSLWSWVFNCNYKGSEIRRLYYFAPLFAIFIAKGVQSFTDFVGCGKTLVPRFVIFNSLAVAYLWSYIFNMGSLSIEQLGGLLVSLDIANVEMLIVFAFFFIISFYPSIGDHKVTL